MTSPYIDKSIERMTDKDAHLELSKDIGKVAAALEGLSATINAIDGRINELSKYVHQRNHDIIDLITERKVETMKMEQKLDRLHDDVQGVRHDVGTLKRLVDEDIKPHIEDYKKMRSKGMGILIAVGTFGGAITWALSNWGKLFGK